MSLAVRRGRRLAVAARAGPWWHPSALACGCLRRAGPLRDAGLAGPEPQLGAAGDEVGGGVLVQADEAVVGLAAESGGLEQRARVAGVADELVVGVGVGHEVTHRGLSGQRG